MNLTGETAVRMIPLARKLGWAAQKKYGMDREDVQQQALLALLEQGLDEGCEKPTLFSTVIMRSALAKEIERGSALKRSMSVQMSDTFDAPDVQSSSDPLAYRKLEECLCGVGEVNAAMFKAVYMMGFTREDVANAVGITTKAATKRIDRVLSKVADDFGFKLPSRRKDESSSRYQFVRDCGDTFTGTRSEFLKYSGLTNGTIGDLFKDGAIKRKGWKVIK